MLLNCRQLLLAAILAVTLGVLAPTASLRAEETRVDCQVLYQTADGLYVDIGSEAGVKPGRAWLEKDGERVALVDVVKAVRKSTFLRVRGSTAGDLPNTGDGVALVFDREASVAPVPPSTSPTLKDQTSAAAPFVPLLAQPDMGDEAVTEAANIFHGRLTLRELFQATSDGDLDASRTSVRTSGSVERLASTPWTLDWSGDLSYRAGPAYEHVRSYRSPRLEVYRLSLYRRFDNWSTLRFGRFIPRELPSVGFLDGVQGEKVLSDTLRVGGMFGFKPHRVRLDPSFNEPTLVPYATFEVGDSPDLRYSITAGLLASMYKGKLDRFALLTDQSAHIGDFSLFSSWEVDVDVGGAAVRSGVDVTRWDLLLSYFFHPAFTAKAGINRFEIPDTAAERDAIDAGILLPEDYLLGGYWRYWLGASHQLPWQLRLSEEVGFTHSREHDGLRWNVGLTRTGLPGFPDGSLTLTVYNLTGIRTEGYGGRISADFPVLDRRLLLQTGAVFRLLEFDTVGANFFGQVSENFGFSDVYLRGRWLFSDAWSLAAGASYGFTDQRQRVLIDLALTFRW